MASSARGSSLALGRETLQVVEKLNLARDQRPHRRTHTAAESGARATAAIGAFTPIPSRHAVESAQRLRETCGVRPLPPEEETQQRESAVHGS